MKFSEINLGAIQADIDAKDAEFLAAMRAIRAETDEKLSVIRRKLGAMLSELAEFDRETHNAYNKRV